MVFYNTKQKIIYVNSVKKQKSNKKKVSKI